MIYISIQIEAEKLYTRNNIHYSKKGNYIQGNVMYVELFLKLCGEEEFMRTYESVQNFLLLRSSLVIMESALNIYFFLHES